MTAPAGSEVTGTLSYVYAVTTDEGGEHVDDEVLGIGDAPVRWVSAAGLRALVGDVDRREFVGAGLEERLEDLSWLAATARAHHHVVDTVGRTRLVAPLALATVYFDDERVREVLVESREGFDAILRRLEGRSEFGLKIWARREDEGERAERPTSGAAYLRARRRALRDSETATDRARAAAEQIDRAVAELAIDARDHRLQDPTLSGTPAPMVLNRAYLVPVERAGELAALVDGLADRTPVTAQLTGPWVPYSFVQAGPA